MHSGIIAVIEELNLLEELFLEEFGLGASEVSVENEVSEVTALVVSEFMGYNVAEIQSFSDVTFYFADHFLPTNAWVMQIKDTLSHLAKYENITFLAKTNDLRSAAWRPATDKKTSNILISKKVYHQKISKSIIYV